MRTKRQARIVAVFIFLILIFSGVVAGYTSQDNPGFGPTILFVTILIYRIFLKPETGLYKWRRGLFNKKKTSSEVTEKSTNDVSHQEDESVKWYKRKNLLNFLIMTLLLVSIGTLVLMYYDDDYWGFFSPIWALTIFFIVLRFRLRENNNDGEPRIFSPSETDHKPPDSIVSLGIADELIKLNKLKKEGVLTDEEFESQKKKLLS